METRRGYIYGKDIVSGGHGGRCAGGESGVASTIPSTSSNA